MDPLILPVEPLSEESHRIDVRSAAWSKVSVGPFSCDACSQEDFLNAIVQEAFTSRSTRLVATVNAQFYVLAARDSSFRELLARADYICADGFPIKIAIGLFSNRKSERIAGVDLVEEICKLGAPRGLRVFFLGGRPGTAQATAQLMKERFHGLQIVGTSCPELGFENDSEMLQPILNSISHAKPHVVFVGLGAPKQELLIDLHLRSLGVPLAMGVGGSFDILTGITVRAPRFAQKYGLEWVYRFAQEPRRLWRRYLLGNLQFGYYFCKYYLRHKLSEPMANG